ncbi:MAG: tetratricopeptide (TPR) repeat protein [Alphaproteobacteria bacterium]|jgi:tetratricopeptide (TPR) repeat protein
MPKHGASKSQGPVKLSIIIASLLASGCAQLDSLSNDFLNQKDVASQQQPHNSLDPLEAYNDAKDPKFILSEAAKLATEEKEYAQALGYWDQIISQYPDYAPAYVGYSNVGRKINAHQKILAKLYGFKATFPQDVSIMSEIAKVYYDLKNYPESLKEIDNALEIEEYDWKLYSLRGVVSDKLNYYSEARASYDKALELSPDNPVVLNNIAASMIRSDELNEAEFYAIRAMETPEANIQIYRTYAKILALQGHNDKAKEFLTQKLDNKSAVNNILKSVSADISQPILWGRR